MSSSLRLECKQKKSSNAFRIRIVLFRTYSFGIEMINKLHSYTPIVPLKTIPSSRQKWANLIPVFRPKRPKTHTRWVSTYLYGLYKGVPGRGHGQ